MAIRSQSLNIALPQTRATASARLAALPNGTIVAVFDSRVDAVGTAVQLAVENPDGSVWIATGAQASRPSSAVPFRGSHAPEAGASPASSSSARAILT